MSTKNQSSQTSLVKSLSRACYFLYSSSSSSSSSSSFPSSLFSSPFSPVQPFKAFCLCRSSIPNLMSEKRKMGLGKEKPGRLVRGVKTVFFLVTMLLSLLLFSAPVLLVITDAVLPSALLSAFLSPLSIQTLGAHLRNYDFRVSIVDIPLISIARSIIIICVYCLCDGPRRSHGPYLTITSLCSLLSVAVVSLKACVFGGGEGAAGFHSRFLSGKETWAMEAMFLCSVALAVGHVVVAYRTSCRERRKLLVYKIDLEAVSACKKGFPAYNKPLLLQVRTK